MRKASPGHGCRSCANASARSCPISAPREWSSNTSPRCTPRPHGKRRNQVPRKSIAKARCALCDAKEVSEPRGDERYCRNCWDKKIAIEEIVAREFALKRYIRAHSAEKYLIYHCTTKTPCGQLIVVDDGYERFLTTVLVPNCG